MATVEQITVQVRVVRDGDGVALVFDSSVLEPLNVTPGTALVASTDGQTLIISRAQDPARRAAIEAAIAEMDAQYGEVFQRLAE
jgi:antitoxin component of MazEF toxin-antitoxin module